MDIFKKIDLTTDIQKITNEFNRIKNQKILDDFNKQELIEVTNKGRLIRTIHIFNKTYSEMDEELKSLVIANLKEFCKLDSGTDLKEFINSINETNYNWNKLSKFIDFPDCRRLILFIHNLGYSI